MPSKRTSPQADLELPIILDEASNLPDYQRLAEAIRSSIRNGQLQAGSRVPPSRVLAQSLKLNRNTVVAALEELLLEGFIRTQGRAGTFVAPNIVLKRSQPAAKPSRWLKAPKSIQPEPEPRFDFRLGATAIHEFPLEEWKSAWRSVARHLPPGDAGPVEGHESLRVAIAAYLGRARGMNCHADQVFITAGANAALQLVTRSVLRPDDILAVEDPGYPLMHKLALEQGVVTLPIAVDDDGLHVERLEVKGLDVEGHAAGCVPPVMVHVTPSHQYPLGGRLTIARRQALLTWAESNDSLILENDYESEFRHDSAPLPALASLDSNGHVVYVGTFSRVLTPALRIGYVVASHGLIDRFKHQALTHGERVTSPVQHVVTELLRSGSLERHIRRVRRKYTERRNIILELIKPLEPFVSVRGTESGLHVFLEVNSAREAQNLIRRCHRQGVALESLEPFFGTKPSRFGVLLGFGGTGVQELQAGVEKLIECFQ
jgi:GntR family transcriptional regulator / MocR family aminotransferase